MDFSPRYASGVAIPVFAAGETEAGRKLKMQLLVWGDFSSNTKQVVPCSQGCWRDASPLPKHL